VEPAAIRDWRKDGDYIAGAVREWMQRHGRQDAPLILMGESYGAERAVAVGDALVRQPRPARIAGVVMISQTVMTGFGVMQQDRNLANALGLPTIAATACYFGKSGLADTDPAACAQKSHAFAMQDYLPALSEGAALSATRRSDTIAGLTQLTGLPEAHFVRAGMAVNPNEYRRLALAPSRRVLGMYDSRYSARVDGKQGWQDPSLDPLLPVMQDAAERYGRTALKLQRSPVDGSAYVLFNPAIHASWRYGPHRDPYGSIDMAGILRGVLQTSGARLLVAGGMFDTVGSYGADRYLVSQLRLPPERVTLRSYRAGHMFYLDSASRKEFLPLLRAFIGGGAAGPQADGARLSMTALSPTAR
jgi:carboxypeptidase C (cathepsin A)